jgi:hypothetical protein
MRALVAALVLGGLAAAHPGKVSRPQSLGLPHEVPADLVEHDGYVLFDGIPGVKGPASNGPPRFSPDDVTRSDVFEEDHAALLPPGARIKRHWNGAGQEIWDYPVGTRLVHRFFLRTAPRRSLFELRIVEKLPDGRWAFGAYEWRGGRKGHLRRVMAHDVFEVDLPRGHVGVEMDRLHPESCRLCHAMHSPQAYQYRDVEHVGPCGFGPANQSLLAQWAPAYQARHGYWPFAS